MGCGEGGRVKGEELSMREAKEKEELKVIVDAV